VRFPAPTNVGREGEINLRTVGKPAGIGRKPGTESSVAQARNKPGRGE